MTLKIKIKNAELILQDEIRRSEESRYDHRLHAVLLIASGMNCPQVAEVLGDAERTVRYWVKSFNEEGLQGLIENERGGRPSRLTSEQLEQIGRALRKTPREVGMNTGIWDGKTLSAYIEVKYKLSIGTRQCQRIIKGLGFRLRKPRPLISHSDYELQNAFKKS